MSLKHQSQPLWHLHLNEKRGPLSLTPYLPMLVAPRLPAPQCWASANLACLHPHLLPPWDCPNPPRHFSLLPSHSLSSTVPMSPVPEGQAPLWGSHKLLGSWPPPPPPPSLLPPPSACPKRVDWPCTPPFFWWNTVPPPLPRLLLSLQASVVPLAESAAPPKLPIIWALPPCTVTQCGCLCLRGHKASGGAEPMCLIPAASLGLGPQHKLLPFK